MKRAAKKANMWPFGTNQPLGGRSYVVKRKTGAARGSVKASPVSVREQKTREDEKLRAKLSDPDLTRKLKAHYSRGGSLKEFLVANPGVSKAQVKRCNPGPRILEAHYDATVDKTHVKFEDGEGLISWSWIPGRIVPESELVKRAKGAKKRLAIAKGKRNPASGAASVYEEFHGMPSTHVTEVTERVHSHEHLAELGRLELLVIAGVDGYEHRISGFKGAALCANETKDQLFIRGGDQGMNLADFGMKAPHEVETLGQVTEIQYFTDKKHLGSEGGRALYFHKQKHGPDLIYRRRDKALEFSGGEYEIRAEGIDK